MPQLVTIELPDWLTPEALHEAAESAVGWIADESDKCADGSCAARWFKRSLNQERAYLVGDAEKHLGPAALEKAKDYG